MIDDAPPPGAPPWLARIYRMGGRRPGESEAQLCERRGVEAAQRAAAHDAGIAAHKARRAALGLPEPPPPMPPAPRDPFIVGQPRRGPGWAS